MAAFSSGLINSMLKASGGFKTALASGIIYVYTGPRPTDADSAVQGTLLLKITVSSGSFSFGTSTNGLNFDAPTLNAISKAAAETWSGVGIAAGTPGWARFMGNASDALGSSTTLPRMDMSVGVSGADLNLSTTAIVIGTPVTVDSLTVTWPKS